MRIADNKIRHCHAVAEYMSENAEKYGLDKDDMYLVGLLHDIGYIFGADGHASSGAEFLKKHNFDTTTAIAWHGTTPQDFMKATLTEEIPNDLRLLYEADMSINAEGEYVGFDARLEDIRTRYGEGKEYNISKAIIDYLKEGQK